MSRTHVCETAWAANLRGFEITGVAVRNRDILQVLARKSLPHDRATHVLDADIPTRILSVFLDDTSDRNLECQELENMAFPKLGVSRAPFERPGGIVVSMGRDGDAWPLGGGNGPLEKIAVGARPATRRLRCLFGFTYSIGIARTMYKRVAVSRWERVEGLPAPRNEDELQAAGFNDLDAFSESDMYAVGGHGDVWHFDGREWRPMGFPAKEQLATVTCGGDGNVYITGEGGSLWAGRQSTWRLLEQRSSSILWNDTRWFDGRLWLASDYQLRVWNGHEIVTPEHEGKPILASGHMDAHEGLLVVADRWSISVFDEHDWRKVVAPC